MNEINWNSPKYQRIASINLKNFDLLITFEDGSTVTLNRDTIVPRNVHNPDWGGIYFNPYELVLPTSSGEVEIPWLTIRLLSDTSFATYWAQKADDQTNDVGQRLRELRQNKGLTSKKVAERAGITPQSLSRIEKGHHDVVFATLKKILIAMGCTLQDLASVQISPSSITDLLKRLETIGIKKEWLFEKILPSETSDVDLTNQIANLISRIFKWSPEQILSGSNLTLNPGLVGSMKFKSQARPQLKQMQAYAFYAHYLSLLVIQATDHLKLSDLPDDPKKIIFKIASNYGSVSLENMLRYIWDHGIPVIPLSDSGAFHGACWKISERKIIVLKQVTKYQGRWLFDLSHELGHMVNDLDEENDNVIEDAEISPFRNDQRELDANIFASDLLFSNKVETFAKLAVERASGKVENLKSAVIQIAAEERIPLDLFANYMAFRLSETNHINWWGAANNLQIDEPSAFYVARKIFNEKVNLELLNSEDRGLLIRALDL